MKAGRGVWVVVAAIAILVVVAMSVGLVLTRGISLAQTLGERPLAWSRGSGVTGPGMMGYGWDGAASGPGVACGGAYGVPGEGAVSALEEVEPAAHAYLDSLGYQGLEVSEVMEFEQNYYAIAVEADTGIGAMELLVDKERGTVGPEPGPNMMWNAKYGMHRGAAWGWGGSAAGADLSISPEAAEQIAQRWLDANLPGRTAGEVDPFYGYYTLHFLEDGDIAGMLSVHGTSGAVWFHGWHGEFVTMVDSHS